MDTINLKGFIQGDHKAWTLKFTDKNRQAIDLNGRRIVFTMKRDIDEEDNKADIRKITDIVTPNTFQFILELNTIDTQDLYGIFKYDIRVSFVNNPLEVQYTPLSGNITINKAVSKGMV